MLPDHFTPLKRDEYDVSVSFTPRLVADISSALRGQILQYAPRLHVSRTWQTQVAHMLAGDFDAVPADLVGLSKQLS